MSRSCERGFTSSDLDKMMTPEQRSEFTNWIYGQTTPFCDGQYYDYSTKRYVHTGCGPHGMCYYPWDVQRFLDGGVCID